MSFSAVVLAGGRASRLGGADKAAVEYAGRTLLAHALDAVHGADEVVVVGDEIPTERPVRFTRESPAYGGPVAALLTGRDALTHGPEVLVVLAVDMPRATTATIARLREALDQDDDHDGAVLIGPDGRRQLALTLRTARLDAVRPDTDAQDGMPMHRLLAPLALVEVVSLEREHRDVDTWADLHDR